MKQFITAIRKSIADRNYFGALFIALAMPDICGALERPDQSVGERYRSWFRRYLNKKYDPVTQMEFVSATIPQAATTLPTEMRIALDVAIDPELKFTADDCYQCRCKCLHEGILRRTGQERFIFLSGLPAGTILHRNLKDGQLVLQVELFTEDICLGVEAWERDMRANLEVAARCEELLSITPWFNL